MSDTPNGRLSRHGSLTPLARLKANARSYANTYLRRGAIARQNCERCGSPASQMHHDDYRKPLQITWMCRPCHLRHHADAPGPHIVVDEELLAGLRPYEPMGESEDFEQSEYAGLKNLRFKLKYRDCEYVRNGRNCVRKLSPVEIAEFRAAVQRAHEAAS